MRLGLISDLHCNVAALERALAMLESCDEIICAGDLMLQYRCEPEVLSLLRRRRAHAITGNHDLTLHASAVGGLLPVTDAITTLERLPRQLRLSMNGTRIAVHHGSPWDRPEMGYYTYLLEADHKAMRQAAAVDADILVLGHTHVPTAVTINGTMIVNPGSCGEPNRDAVRAQTCAAVDLSSREVTFYTIDG